MDSVRPAYWIDRLASDPELNFERGNQTQRAVTSVKGASKVQVHLKVSTRDGNALVEKDVQGTVRFFGENLKATYSLAKRIAKTLSEATLPAPTPAKAAGQYHWVPTLGRFCRG